MKLEPCSVSDFNAEVIRYASRPDFTYRIVEGERCEGYAGGELVLLIKRIGPWAHHFRKPPAVVLPRSHPEGFTYK